MNSSASTMSHSGARPTVCEPAPNTKVRPVSVPPTIVTVTDAPSCSDGRAPAASASSTRAMDAPEVSQFSPITASGGSMRHSALPGAMDCSV